MKENILDSTVALRVLLENIKAGGVVVLPGSEEEATLKEALRVMDGVVWRNYRLTKRTPTSENKGARQRRAYRHNAGAQYRLRLEAYVKEVMRRGET